MMRAAALICVLLALCWPGVVRAQTLAQAGEVSAADQQAIEQVITSQLDAFRRDAGDRAFSFASPNIQALFGDAPHFMAMVQQGYPPVYRSRSATFEPTQTVDGRIEQRVRLVGPDGAEALAIYTMEREPDGSWRIDGCALTKPEGVTT